MASETSFSTGASLRSISFKISASIGASKSEGFTLLIKPLDCARRSPVSRSKENVVHPNHKPVQIPDLPRAQLHPVHKRSPVHRVVPQSQRLPRPAEDHHLVRHQPVQPH